MDQAEIDLIRRALELRKQRKIGVLWAESGRYWISESEVDPWGSRRRITLLELQQNIEAARQLRRAPDIEKISSENEKKHLA